MSLLRNALLTPTTPLNRRQLEEVARRKVIVHQDIILQPATSPIPPPGMTSTQEEAAPDVRAFFETFRPDGDNEPPRLSMTPTLHNLLATYDPDLDESLPDLSLSNVGSAYPRGMSPPLSLLSNMSADDFESRKKRNSAKPTKKVKKSGSSKQCRNGVRLSCFRKKYEKNSPYGAWPVAPPRPVGVIAGPVEVGVHEEVRRSVFPQVCVGLSEHEFVAEDFLSQTVVENEKFKNSMSYAQSVKKRYFEAKKFIDGHDARKRALLSEIADNEAQQLALAKQNSFLRANLQKENMQQEKSLACIVKDGPRVQEWNNMCRGYLDT